MRVVIVVVAGLLTSIAPAGAAPRWCRSYKATDEVYPDQAKSAFESYQHAKQELSYLPEAARFLCGKPDDRLAADVLAAWMRETGLAEADAIASLEARVSPTWESDHAALCNAMGGDFSNDQKGAMMSTRKTLLGCENSDRDDPAWMARGDSRFDAVRPYLDAGADRDELVRLAWVLGEVRHMLNPQERGPVLASYALVQFDMKALDRDAAMKEAAAAPLRGNLYARTIVAESFAWTKMHADRVEAAVAKTTQDATWKDLIVTVPQKAYAEWSAAAAAHKDVLAHGATPDCATLRADVVAVIKPLDKGNFEEVEGRLNDAPLAGMLIGRYVACLGEDGDRAVRKAARIFAGAVPEIRGPREAAYVATRKALAALAKTKKHPPFDGWHDLSQPEEPRYTNDGESFSDSPGVLQTVKRVKGGDVAVTFAQDKFRYTVFDCKDTNKIDRIAPDGKVQYRQVCHEAGTAIGDHAPSPATVPAECTAGVAKGRFVYIGEEIPWLIYTDKSRKKVVAAYCLPFE